MVISNFNNKIIRPLLQIYSYELFYLEKNDKLDFYFDFDESLVNKYRIFISNIEGKVEVDYEEYNSFSLFGKRELSMQISENINKISFINQNETGYSLINIKVYYQISENILTELDFLDSYITTIGGCNVLPLIYYMKVFVDLVADICFNFYFDEEYYEENLIIRGMVVDYEQIKYIDENTDIYSIKSEVEIEGKYDYFTKTGLIIFDNKAIEKNSKNKFEKDKYYLIIIEKENNDLYTQFSVEAIVNSKNETYLFLNKYMRSSFNLLDNNTIYSKNFYITDKNWNKDIYTIVFSSNYKNIEIKFSDSIIIHDIKKDGNIEKYFISMQYLEDTLDNYCTVQLNKINKDFKNVNYIIKVYKGKSDDIFKFKEKYFFNPINTTNDKEVNYSLVIKNEYTNNNINNNYYYNYYLRLYLKKDIIKDEVLNTIAYTNSKIMYYKIISTNDSNIELSYILENLFYGEEYVVTLFIDVENKKENNHYYYSLSFDLKTNDKESIKDKKKYIIIIISIAFCVILIIIISIFILCVKKFKNKNKKLKEEVNAISFVTGINDFNGRESVKSDKDYESSFI